MHHKTTGISYIETKLVRTDDNREHIQISIHDTINNKIVYLNKTQLVVFTSELRRILEEMV